MVDVVARLRSVIPDSCCRSGDAAWRRLAGVTAPPAPPSTATALRAPAHRVRATAIQQSQRDGHTPDPKAAQIERLRADVDKLKTLLAQATTTINELTNFRTQALARLAAQHEEILRLRRAADPKTNVAHLPAARPHKIIGPC